MNTGINYPALAVLIGLFLLVTVMGFWASNWRRGEHLASLDEWGLGGRTFGTWITWFLLGGDLYTAYTFVAVPAAMFALGSVSGFFAVPYTIILYPIIFIYMSRLWSVSYRHGYVTAADFVRGRYGSKELSLAIAITGILATMPYIALQLVGIQAVLEVVGLGGSGSVIAKDLPLFIAFALLAAYTYSAGLRAPAVIAFVKDGLIYLVIIVAIIYLPSKVGGWAHVFAAAEAKMTSLNAAGRPVGVFIPSAQAYWAYATLALGSALALFMYPHSITATLSSRSRNTIRHNATILPAYSFVLGLLALLGWVAIAAGTKPIGLDGVPNAQLVIPQLFEDSFPGWFAGVAFAAVAIGALVPAAIMSIAAANTFTRNIYREWIKPERHARRGSQCFQDRLAAREGLCAGVRADAGQAERHQFPTARRHLDPPDVPRDRLRPVYTMVPPLGAARRLGCWHVVWDDRGVQRDQSRHRQPLRRIAVPDPRHRPDGVYRTDSLRHQRRHCGRVDRDPERRRRRSRP